MKVIKHPDTYLFELTNTEFKVKELVEFLEEQPIPTPLYSVGDEVLVWSHYDGYQPCRIVDHFLAVDSGFLSDEDYVSKTQFPYTNRVGTLFSSLKDYLSKAYKRPVINVLYTLDNYVEINKDGDCENTFYEYELVPLKNTTWCEDFSSAPSSQIVIKSIEGFLNRADGDFVRQFHELDKNYIAWLKSNNN
jgi:hypothetical protein